MFEVLNENLENIQSICKITKESIIDTHGERNKNIDIYDIERTFKTFESILDPINTELSELLSGADYLFWNNKNSVSFWDKVEDIKNDTLKKANK